MPHNKILLLYRRGDNPAWYDLPFPNAVTALDFLIQHRKDYTEWKIVEEIQCMVKESIQETHKRNYGEKEVLDEGR